MKHVSFILFFFIHTIIVSQTMTIKDAFLKNDNKYISYDITFQLGKATIIPGSFTFLDEMAAFIKSDSSLIIEIGNHTDERYSAKSSSCLTCARAKAIAEYLIGKGVRKEQLIYKGYNATKPIIKNAKTEEEHQKNRRTEFIIMHH